MQEQINFKGNQATQNENIFTTNSLSNSSGEWDSRFYALFCNDYLEIKSEPKQVKRLPILTFGGPNGCFQPLNTNWNTDYNLQFDNNLKKSKISFTNLSFKSKNSQDVLKINFKSPFYQNSIHGRLLAKYNQNQNQDYLDLAQELESVFFPKIISNLETEFLRRAKEITRKKEIYLIEKNDEINFPTLISNLKFSRNTLSDYGKNQSSLLSKQYWNNLLLSQKQEERIQELLQSDELKKQLAENQKRSKKTLKELIEYIKKWNQANLLQAFSFNIAKLDKTKYQNFKNKLKTELAKLSDDKTKNPMILIEDYIEVTKFPYLFEWMNEILLKIAKKNLNNEEKIQINWLTAHITLIKNKIKAKIETPQIVLLNKIENLKKIQQEDSNQHSISSKKWLLDNEKKIKVNLSLKKIEMFSQEINQQSQLLSKYLKIKSFFREKEEWSELNPQILEKKFFDYWDIEKLSTEEINHLYLLIQDKIEKLNFLVAEGINNIHHAIKINNDYEIKGKKKYTRSFFWVWKLSLWNWKKINFQISPEWTKSETQINNIIIEIFKDGNNDVDMQSFLFKLKNQSLSMNSKKAKLRNWNKLTWVINSILKKLSNYFFDDLEGFTTIALQPYIERFAKKELKKLQKDKKFSKLFWIWDLDLKTRLNSKKKVQSQFKIVFKILQQHSDVEDNDRLDYFSKTWLEIKEGFPWWYLLMDEIKMEKLTNAMLKLLLEKKNLKVKKENYLITGNSNLEKILNINHFLVEKEKATKFYENVNFHSEENDLFVKLQTSENSLKWIQKVNKEQQEQEKKTVKEKLLKKLDKMVTEGFNIYETETKIKFPQKEIDIFLQKLLEPDKHIWKGKIRKEWTFDSDQYSDQVYSKLSWNEVAKIFRFKIETVEKREILVQLPENDLNFLDQYKKENWFNKLIWDHQLAKGKTNNLLEPLTKENWMLFYKANAILNNFEASQFKSNLIFDQKSDKKYLMIKPNNSFKFNLTQGRQAFLENEIVISPIFARNWNLKLGDEINLFGLKQNFKIVGIGVQGQFLYQIISSTSFIPQKNEGIFYPTKKTYEEGFQKKEKISSENFTFEKKEQIIFNYQGKSKKTLKHDLNKFAIMIGFNSISFTKRSFELNGQFNELEELEIQDSNQGREKIINLNDYSHLPYEMMNKFVLLNQKIIFYPSLAVMVVFILIISFVTFCMIDQKIKNNRKEMAILKSLGIKDNKILIGASPIIIFIFATILVGWIIGVFLQIPLFNTIESFLNLEFKRYEFNFVHLLIVFSMITAIIVFTFVFFGIFKLSKMGVMELMYGKRKKPNTTINKIKNILINKTGLSKYLVIKMNYIFFSTVFKKMFILFLVFIITTISVLSNILFLTVASQTIYEHYKDINHNYEVVYSQPFWNHPLSRKKIITNRGYDHILQKKSNFVTPLENQGLQVFLQENGGKPWEHKFKTVNEIMWFMLPLHWKSLNFNWLKKVTKEDKSGNAEEKICLIIGDILKSVIKIKNIKKCLSSELEQLLPFKVKNKIIYHIPFGGNGIKFDPEQDELFTETRAYLNSWSEDNFNVYGLNENTDAFHFNTQTKKVVFENKQDPNTEIKVVANNNFLKKFNQKVGNVIPVFIMIKTMNRIWLEKIYKSGDWEWNLHWVYHEYLDSENWIYQKQDGKEIPLEKIDDDARFYTGSELNNSDDWEINDQEIKYQGKNVKILYQNENGEFKPWLNIERIKIKTKFQQITPFMVTSKKNKFNPFTKWINDDQIWINHNFKKVNLKIMDQIQEIKKPRIFMNQGTLNQILKWPTTKTKHHQYKWFNGRFSKNKKITNFMFNIPLNSKYGYFDAQVIGDSRNQATYDVHKINAPLMEKNIIYDFTNYLIKLVIIFLISEFLMIIFFCGFLIINTTKSLEKNALELKLLGYPKKVILLQLIQVIFLPFLAGFIVGAIVTRHFVSYIMQYISQASHFEMYFNDSFWLIFLGFTILMIVLMFLFWRKNKQLKKTNWNKLINNI